MSFISGTGLTSGQSSSISSITVDKDQITNDFIKDTLIISSNYTDSKTEANSLIISTNSEDILANSALITTNSENILANSALIATNTEDDLANSALVTTNSEDTLANSALIATNSEDILAKRDW